MTASSAMPSGSSVECIAERLLQRLDKTSSPKGCWLWLGNRRATRHGQMKVRFPDGVVEWQVHRIAYRCFIGPIPDSLWVLHKRHCNDGACCNPDHLYAGNVQENVDDREATGGTARGNKSGQAKLIDSDVQKIRALKRAWIS